MKVTVYSTGLLGTPITFDMQVTGPGWAGWGVLGGILAVVLLVWQAWSLKRRRASVGAAAVAFVLAAATAGFTIWQALTGEVHVVGGEETLFVTVARLWPAEAIALAAVVAAAATIRLVLAALEASDRTEHRAEGESLAPPAAFLIRRSAQRG